MYIVEGRLGGLGVVDGPWTSLWNVYVVVDCWSGYGVAVGQSWRLSGQAYIVVVVGLQWSSLVMVGRWRRRRSSVIVMGPLAGRGCHLTSLEGPRQHGGSSASIVVNASHDIIFP